MNTLVNISRGDIIMILEDVVLQSLLDLDGERFLIDEVLGLWVKFDVKRVPVTRERPHGIRYSLTLHNRLNERILGFDNSHALRLLGKKNVDSFRVYDHWHSNGTNQGKRYCYVNSAKLLEDFYSEVHRAINILKEVRNEHTK